MDAAFGPAYARSWAQDTVIPDLGCTVNQAIEAGADTRDIWRAVCQVGSVPPSLH